MIYQRSKINFCIQLVNDIRLTSNIDKLLKILHYTLYLFTIEKLKIHIMILNEKSKKEDDEPK